MTPEEKRKLADWIRKLVKDEVDKAMSKPKRQKKDYPANYEELWSAWLDITGRPAGKDAGLKAYTATDFNHEMYPNSALIKSIKAYMQTEWHGKDKAYIPHLSKFLNQGYYKAEIKTVRKADTRRRCGCGAYALDGQDKCAKCQCERTE